MSQNRLLCWLWNFTTLGGAFFAIFGQHRSTLWLIVPLVLFMSNKEAK